MERGTSLSKASACRATRKQKLVNKLQLEVIRNFITIGNQNSTLRAYVLKVTGLPESVWNQMLIFLALSGFKPRNTAMAPTTYVDEVWHRFILCTREYSDFCLQAAGEYIHHVPDALSILDTRVQWFEKPERLTAFLGVRVPEYREWIWEDPHNGSCGEQCKD